MKKDISNWYPLCVEKPRGKFVGHNATGHLLPCCWCENTDDPDFDTLLQDHLKIENVDGIDEIILSNEWLEFVRILVEDPLKAPKSCWRYCGKGKGFKIKGQELYK